MVEQHQGKQPGDFGFVGQGNKFELWDEAKWLERTEQAVAFPAGGLPPELDGFSL